MKKQQKIKFFKSEFKRFIKFFNLLDNSYFYREVEDPTMEAQVVAYSYDDLSSCDQRSIELQWSKQWIESKDIKEKDLSMAAFHEALEVLLVPLENLALCRDTIVTSREIHMEKHRIIRIFENKLFGLVK